MWTMWKLLSFWTFFQKVAEVEGKDRIRKERKAKESKVKQSKVK